MPRHVDHEERRDAIIQATLAVLAEHGPSGLTFRAVAKRMGGSSTLVTHYLPNRQELLDALVEQMAEWPEELLELEAGADDPREKLRVFLLWLLPVDERGWLEERARLSLAGEPAIRERTQHLLDSWDTNVRRLMAEHLTDLVPPDRLPVTVDVLRSITNGLTLTWAEHPGEWPPERQFAVVDETLAALGLLPAPIVNAEAGG